MFFEIINCLPFYCLLIASVNIAHIKSLEHIPFHYTSIILDLLTFHWNVLHIRGQKGSNTSIQNLNENLETLHLASTLFIIYLVLILKQNF